MAKYFLLLKTHNITGLKYLCYTSQKNPFKYPGSGKRWKLHIKKHGRDINTEILGTFIKKENLIKEGIKYSKKWNVVDSDEFANLRDEEGDGGDTSGFIDYKKMKPMPRGKWKRPDFAEYNKTRVNPRIKILKCTWCGEEGYGKEWKKNHFYNCKDCPLPKYNYNQKFYEVNGEELTPKEIQKKFNLSESTFSSRLWQGWSIKKIISTPLQEANKYNIFGEELTVGEISKKFNITKKVVYTCLYSNFPIQVYISENKNLIENGHIFCPHCDKKINTTRGIYLHFDKCKILTNELHHNEKKYQYGRRKITIREASKISNISITTIQNRLTKGKSMKEAIEMGGSQKGKNYIYREKAYTKGQFLKKYKIANTTLHRNLNKGLSLEEIVNKFGNK